MLDRLEKLKVPLPSELNPSSDHVEKNSLSFTTFNYVHTIIGSGIIGNYIFLFSRRIVDNYPNQTVGGGKVMAFYFV